MHPIELIRHLDGDVGVQRIVRNGLDELAEAERLLASSLAIASLEAYRDVLHHLQNTAGELGLDALMAELRQDRDRVIAGGALDNRLQPHIAAARSELRRLLAP